MKYFLLFLLPLISLGEGPHAPALGPKMGPEIEFRGKKQIPSMLCQAVLETAGAMVVTGAAGSVFATAKGIYEDDSSGLMMLAPMGLGTTSGAVTLMGCMFVSIKGNAVTDGYLQRIHANLLPREKEGKLKTNWTSSSKWRALEVEFANGRKIVFSKDPSVVEVKLPPIRPEELATDLEFYEKEIFNSARAVGLKIPRFDGPWNGGHLHIDIAEAFDSDPTKLKNFLLDYIEHPELAEGVLVRDFYNAPAIDPVKQQSAIQAVVEQLDAWAEKGEKLTREHLVKLVNIGPFSKRDALNLNLDFGTLEIRGLRSQKSAAELLRVMRLFDGRIKYTNSLPAKEFKPKNVRLRRAEKANAFRRYVEEAGLDYEEFKLLAPRIYRENCAGRFSSLLGF